jgi:hypothetical protein
VNIDRRFRTCYVLAFEGAKVKGREVYGRARRYRILEYPYDGRILNLRYGVKGLEGRLV